MIAAEIRFPNREKTMVTEEAILTLLLLG